MLQKFRLWSLCIYFSKQVVHPKNICEPHPFLWNKQKVEVGLSEVELCRPLVLATLKELLDNYHGEPRPLAYYDLLASDWLEHFTHLVYVAWQETLAGNIPPEATPMPVSADLSDAAKQRWQNSGLHEHLRWTLAKLLDGASSIDWGFERESAVITGGAERFPLRLLRSFTVARPDILVTFPYYKCSHKEWAGALWRWRHWLAWNNLQYPIRVSVKLDTAWRKSRAAAALPATNLNELVQVLLPLHLPVALLEGFTEYRNAVLAFPVTRPKAVYSAVALHSHLAWKLAVAEWRQQGTLLLYHQHGGAYGLDPTNTVEEFETRVSDRYYTWGWRRAEQHVKPLSAPPPDAPPRARKWLLLSCTDFPRVVYRLHFHPMLGAIQAMHRETCEFLAALPDRSKLLVRPYPHDYGWGFADAMRMAAPDATFDDHSKKSSVRHAESRLVIHNYLGTGWLETLALDIPTVCFYDPETYAFREAAQPYIDALERVGVLHCSGAAAARFVSRLGDDIEGWWSKSEVQEARRNFVEHYANFSPDWKMQWEREFESVLDGADSR